MTPSPSPIPPSAAHPTDDEPTPPASAGRGNPTLPVFFGLCAGLVIAVWLDSDSIHRARGVCRAERLTVTLDHAARVEDLAVHDGELVLPGQPLLHWTDLELEAEIARRQQRVDELSGRLTAADAKYDAELSRRMAALDDAIRSRLAGDLRRTPGKTTPVAFATNRGAERGSDRLEQLQRWRLELPSRLRAELAIPALRWELVAAEASLAELRGQAARRTLLAPAAGFVARMDVRSGAVQPAGRAVLTLSVPGRSRILSELPAARLKELAVGDRVQIDFGDGPLCAATVAELRPGRHIAGTASAAADRRFVTAHLAPCKSDEWPTVRDGSKVTVIW